MNGLAAVGEALSPWFRDRLEAAQVEIENLRRHAEGWSWQTYTLDVSWRPDGMAARGAAATPSGCEPRDGLLAPYDIDGQYRLHRAVLDHSDVPMADLYWLEHDTSVLGMPFYVMERLEGVVPVQWRGQDPAVFPTDETRRAIGLQFVDIEARIHAIRWDAAELTCRGRLARPGGIRVLLDRPLGRLLRGSSSSTCRSFAMPSPGCARTWPARACSRSVTATTAIRDFLLRDGTINGIFDWELAHVSDPVEDIAWSGLPLFRGRNPMLSHLLAPGEYFARYEERTSLRVDPDVFSFWTMLGLVKAAASHLRGSRAFEEGRIPTCASLPWATRSQYVLRHLAAALGLEEGGR